MESKNTMIEIIALLIVAVTVYLLIKQYETRMVLIGSGLLMSCWLR